MEIAHIANPFHALSEYELIHLIEHMIEADEANLLHQLLALETNEKQNAWFEIKNTNGYLDSFVEDIIVAWENVDKSIIEDINKTIQSINLQIKYSLILSSVRSLSNQVPPNLIAGALERGIWKFDEALFHARHLSSPLLRYQALVMLAELNTEFRDDILLEGLNAVSLMGDPDIKMNAFKEIGAKIDDKRLGNVLKLSTSIGFDNWQLGKTIISLAERFPEELLSEAIEITNKITWWDYRAETLLGLVEFLSVRNLDKLKELMKNIDFNSYQSPLQSAIKKRYLEIEERVDRKPTENKNSLHMTPDLANPNTKIEILLSDIENDHTRSRGEKGVRLINLFPELRGELQGKALKTVEKLVKEEDSALSVSGLIEGILPFLEDKYLGVVQKLIANYSNSGMQPHSAITALAVRYAKIGKIKNSLVVMKKLFSAYSEIGAIAKLMIYMPAEEQKKMLKKAYAIVKFIATSESFVSEDIALLAKNLVSISRYDDAVRFVGFIGDDKIRFNTVLNLSNRLCERRYWKGALILTDLIDEPSKKIDILLTILHRLPKSDYWRIVSNILRLLEDISDKDVVARVLRKLPSRVAFLKLSQMIIESKKIDDIDALIYFDLLILAKHKHHLDVKELLFKANNINNGIIKVNALLNIICLSPEKLCDEYAIYCESTILGLSNEQQREEYFIMLLKILLDNHLFDHATRISQKIGISKRYKILKEYYPILPENNLKHLVSQLLREKADRSIVLEVIDAACWLPREERTPVLVTALEIAEKINSDRGIICSIFRLISKEITKTEINIIYKELKSTKDDYLQYSLINILVNMVAEEIIIDITKMIVLQISDKKQRSDMLSAIARNLPTEFLENLVAKNGESINVDARVKIYITILSRKNNSVNLYQTIMLLIHKIKNDEKMSLNLQTEFFQYMNIEERKSFLWQLKMALAIDPEKIVGIKRNDFAIFPPNPDSERNEFIVNKLLEISQYVNEETIDLYREIICDVPISLSTERNMIKLFSFIVSDKKKKEIIDFMLAHYQTGYDFDLIFLSVKDEYSKELILYILNRIAKMKNVYQQISGLRKVAKFVPNDLVSMLVNIANSLPVTALNMGREDEEFYFSPRFNALTNILSCVAAKGKIQLALQIFDELVRNDAVSDRTIESISEYLSIAPQDYKDEFVSRSLNLLSSMEQYKYINMEFLISLQPHVSEKQIMSAIAILLSLSNNTNELLKNSALLRKFINVLMRLPAQKSAEVWMNGIVASNLFRIIAEKGREFTIVSICEFIPLLVKISEPEIVDHTSTYVETVYRWWQ